MNEQQKIAYHQIEKEIKIKVGQYMRAQKRYNGDSALSKKIEMQIDILEQRQKKLLEVNNE